MTLICRAFARPTTLEMTGAGVGIAAVGLTMFEVTMTLTGVRGLERDAIGLAGLKCAHQISCRRDIERSFDESGRESRTEVDS